MWRDPIVDEVRAIREAYAKRFGYDLQKIGADLIKKQEARAAAASRAKSKKSDKSTPTKRKPTTPTRRKAA